MKKLTLAVAATVMMASPVFAGDVAARRLFWSGPADRRPECLATPQINALRY